jgi:hypothetical protein
MHNRLLLTLISSSAFKAYFDMLGSGAGYGAGLVPIRQQIPSYLDLKRTLQPKVAGDVKVKPDVQLAQGEEDLEGKENLEEEAEGEEWDSSSFLKFIKTLVVHFTAKRALEKHCFRIKDRDVKISLLSVERSRLIFPAQSWITMKDMIEALFSSDPSSASTDGTAAATKALRILEDKVLKTSHDNSKLRNVIANFKLIIEDGKSVFIPGGMHCETVLATLGKHYESIFGQDESDDKANLISTCKVLL